MSKPINVGDLVCVVRVPPCGCPDRVGHFFNVTRIRLQNDTGKMKCRMCGARQLATGQLVAEGHPSGATVWIGRLIRIDPPATGDSLPTRKRMKEPA